jgi:hypothetical protein
MKKEDLVKLSDEQLREAFSQRQHETVSRIQQALEGSGAKVQLISEYGQLGTLESMVIISVDGKIPAKKGERVSEHTDESKKLAEIMKSQLGIEEHQHAIKSLSGNSRANGKLVFGFAENIGFENLISGKIDREKFMDAHIGARKPADRLELKADDIKEAISSAVKAASPSHTLTVKAARALTELVGNAKEALSMGGRQ